jgi:hypothetical protein
MLSFLYNSREFRHVPIRERRKAAWEARQRSMKHWQFWIAIILLMVTTVVGSWIARHWFGDKPNGTIGAACGFLLGVAWHGMAAHCFALACRTTARYFPTVKTMPPNQTRTGGAVSGRTFCPVLDGLRDTRRVAELGSVG